MEMWMHKIGTPDETRYVLYPMGTKVIVDTDETEHLFLLIRYWKNNEGEFERCKTDPMRYITTSALLKDYVLIDSNVDKVLKQQSECVYELRKANMEENALITSFRDTCAVAVENIDKNCSLLKETEDEGD